MEGQRLATIFAHDFNAYQRWLARVSLGDAVRVAGSGGGGLAGAELERVLLSMAVTNPDIVAVRRGQVH